MMRLLKTTIAVAIASGVTAGSALGQTTPPAQPAKPPATAPAQPQTPAPAPTTTPAPAVPTPPAPYPEGAKIAYVDLQEVASNSTDGKAATARLQELDKKKFAAINEKNKALETARTKRTAASVTEAAQLSLDREIDKLTREVQYMQQEAQVEREQLQEELRLEFQKKLFPVFEAIGKEKRLHVIVDAANSGAFWADRGLDLTAEVIKRLDVNKPAGAPKK
jgi:Skp family chaperone for outer membrane proteins